MRKCIARERTLLLFVHGFSVLAAGPVSNSSLVYLFADLGPLVNLGCC